MTGPVIKTAKTGKTSAEASTQPKTVRLTRARRNSILKALADPRRFELLERVAGSSCRLGCAEALSALAIAPATLSHHIKELEAAGLVRVEREGKFIYLSLRSEAWSALLATLSSLGQPRAATS